jgi:hypothetical protein
MQIEAKRKSPKGCLTLYEKWTYGSKLKELSYGFNTCHIIRVPENLDSLQGRSTMDILYNKIFSANDSHAFRTRNSWSVSSFSSPLHLHCHINQDNRSGSLNGAVLYGPRSCLKWTGDFIVTFILVLEACHDLHSKKKKSYPSNRPWRPIRLWDVKDPTLSRQSAHRFFFNSFISNQNYSDSIS